MLISAGYHCRAVAGGLDAFALLESGEKFDLLLTDILNAPMDGFTLLQFMKQKFPHVPVVIASAVKDQSLAFACFHGGAYAFIPKPFEREQLLATVSRALANSGLGRLYTRMERTIEDYLTHFSNTLHPDVSAECREVLVRLCRESLMEFSHTIGDIEASELRSEHISRYVATLDERGTDKVFKQTLLSTVRKFCAWLVRTKALTKNPVPSRLCGSWWDRSWVSSLFHIRLR